MSEDLGNDIDEFAKAFVDRIKILKSLVLLRSALPSEAADKVLEELDAGLTKAERSMNTLKCKLAEECQSLRYAEEFQAVSLRQTKQVDHIKTSLGPAWRQQSLEIQRNANTVMHAEEQAATRDSNILSAVKENVGPNSAQPAGSQRNLIGNGGKLLAD